MIPMNRRCISSKHRNGPSMGHGISYDTGKEPQRGPTSHWPDITVNPRFVLFKKLNKNRSYLVKYACYISHSMYFVIWSCILWRSRGNSYFDVVGYALH